MDYQLYLAELAEILGVVALTMLIGISPRIKAVPVVGFKYEQREGKISLILAAILLVFSILVNILGKPLLLHQQRINPSLSPLLLQTIQAVSALLMIVFLLWRRGQPAKSSGWHPLLWKSSLQFSIALLFLMVFLRGKVFTLLNGVESHLWIVLLLLLLTALAEETVFRGYLQMRLSSFWNPTLSWLGTAVLFILWQLPFMFHPQNLSGAGMLQFVLVIIRAFLAGWMMQKTRHVLAPAVYRAVSVWLILI